MSNIKHKFCDNCNHFTSVFYDIDKNEYCSECKNKHIEKPIKDNINIPIENRCDRIKNDLTVIRGELVFSKNFTKQFALEEVSVIAAWINYIEELKEKIKVKKMVNKLGSKPIY